MMNGTIDFHDDAVRAPRQINLLKWSLIFAVLSICFRAYQISKSKRIPETIPRIGWKNEWFSVIRASFRDAKHGFEMAEEGYRKVGYKKSKKSPKSILRLVCDKSTTRLAGLSLA
jgi:hypothetical protein